MYFLYIFYITLTQHPKYTQKRLIKKRSRAKHIKKRKRKSKGDRGLPGRTGNGLQLAH